MKVCPFCGSKNQIVLPCEVHEENAKGVYRPKLWHQVLCQCMASGRAGRTEPLAVKNWNHRHRLR